MRCVRTKSAVLCFSSAICKNIFFDGSKGMWQSMQFFINVDVGKEVSEQKLCDASLWQFIHRDENISGSLTSCLCTLWQEEQSILLILKHLLAVNNPY